MILQSVVVVWPGLPVPVELWWGPRAVRVRPGVQGAPAVSVAPVVWFLAMAAPVVRVVPVLREELVVPVSVHVGGPVAGSIAVTSS